ncbi:ubiquitin carboxyl-terminal hydrolase 36 [Hetaerina americana]|uniref:ubiquitin carboxyl-terminal hydrolase 36 n=1 Tax=Hetaerina americana TaxID=62018 RepID=UPI003A7F0F90
MLSYMLPVEGGDKGPASSNRSQEEEGNEEEEGRKAMGGVVVEEEEEDDLDEGEHRRLLDCTSDSRRAMKPPMVPVDIKANSATSTTGTTMVHHSSKTTNEMSILINSPDKGVNSTTEMDSLPTTHGEHKPKPKLILNGTKQPGSLKRVSFGSSKGSMVETLIFESPLQEEPETSPIQEVPPDGGTGSSRAPYFPGSAVPHPHSLAYTHSHHNGGTDHGHHHGHYPGSDHSSSSPHGVGSPSSGAIGKVTSASSSLSSASTATAAEAATSKVRVTFFESEKPHVVVGSPEPLANAFDAATEDLLSLPLDAQGLASGSQQQQQLLLLATSTMTSPSPIAVPPYDRQTSTDSGWDNPFRPDGDLSREADEIVELIKGGKPITPTPGSVAPPLPSVEDSTDGPPSTPPGVHEKATSVPLTNSVKPDGVAKPPSSPKGGGTGANGNAAPATTAVAPSKGPSSVEVQRGHVPPGDQCQVEHVVLKKKPKCKCCVIQ